MGDRKVVVKKVAAYPIATQLVIESSGSVIPGQIVRLTQSGFLVEVDDLSVKLGKEYEVRFKLPASDRRLAEKVKVVKTYDRYNQGGLTLSQSAKQSTEGGKESPVDVSVSASQSKIKRLAEMHFLRISLEEKKWIRDFIMSIHQAPEKPR